MMKQLKFVSRILTGIVFIFSGTVKAIDPMGSAYKFHDYFHAFKFNFPDSLTLPLAILLCTAEFLAGFSVISGIKQKTGIWLVMILMIIFTPLTLILALTNPVSDCGCFGDAIHLTNWQTFGKNVILITLAIILFSGRNSVRQIFTDSREWIIIIFAAVLFIVFAAGNLRYLPVIDFMPYKTGVKIAEKMVIPEGSQPDIYNTTLIYEKNGERKRFTLENYPADDTTWKFIDQESILVKKGYTPPIHDLNITSAEKGDITGSILADPGYSMLMISSRLSEADPGKLSEGFEIGRYCSEKGINFHILTASGTDQFRNYPDSARFCSVDETTLKTMVRANPGYMLLKEGVIRWKWSWATIPGEKWFDRVLSGNYPFISNNRRIIFIVYSVAAAAIFSYFIIFLLIRTGRERNDK
jgi:uncharacterized membrane protein YphA (DoxX/SURF4 family)